jgi:hypothetical protein
MACFQERIILIRRESFDAELLNVRYNGLTSAQYDLPDRGTWHQRFFKILNK